jgi:hypothetical protein
MTTEAAMAREDWRDHDGDRTRRRDWPARDNRDDFGQADYSSDYDYDPRTRTAQRADERYAGRDDYGQADYTSDWAYDPERGRPYRRFSNEDRSFHDRDGDGQPDRGGRSWMDKAGDFLAGRPRHPDDRRHDYEGDDRRRAYEDRRDYDAERSSRRRRGPSDRVLWAVIMERLEDERRLDLRDVDVTVRDGEVTLNGTVRHKEDRRRIEDIADIDGVRHVQNNLRARDADRRWMFF